MAQLLFISFDIKQNNVSLVSPGEDQVVVCAPMVYLEATLAGDITGHTTEWVQLSGTPTVTLFQTSETQAYYVAGTNPGSDKVFRFYIDRNTQIEQYMDVNIRVTPSSELRMLEYGVIKNIVNDPNLLRSEPFDVEGDFPFAITPFNSLGMLVEGQVSGIWSLPLVFKEPDSEEVARYKAAYQGSILQEYAASQWITLGNYNREDTRSYTFNNDKRLRVLNVFYLPNKGTFTVPTQWEDISPSGNSLIKGKEVLATLEHGLCRNNVTLSRVVFVNTLLDTTLTLPLLEAGVVKNNVVLGRFVFILNPLDYIEDLTQTEHGVVKNIVTISRTNGGVIGG